MVQNRSSPSRSQRALLQLPEASMNAIINCLILNTNGFHGIGSYLELVQNFLWQNKANIKSLLSLPPGAMASVIVSNLQSRNHAILNQKP